MVSLFESARKVQSRLLLVFSALVLVACTTAGGPLINTRAPVPVALLVPGSADPVTASLSSGLENGARLAIADLAGVEIDLRVYTTGGNPQMAAAAATQAINDGARIILGPVFAEAANAAGVAAASRGINVLAFSNNPTIAGGNLFILGATFQNTANRLVAFAAGRGRDDILIVHGQSAAEELGRDAVARAISANGNVPAGVAGFPLTQQDVLGAIPQIAAQVRATNADAIFLTSGTDGALPFLAEILPENGVDPAIVQYIGLQRLDVPASALTLGGLQGAWFALPDPELAQAFRSRYEAAFGVSPHPLSGLAYDGIAAIGALVATGDADALTTSALTRPEGFAGTGGVFRLRADGTNQRGLAVAQVDNGQVIFIDPAPRRFDDLGF